MKALSIIKGLLEDDENPFIDSGGTKRWYQNGKLHRLDGPAVEWPDGTKYWYQNGQRHCLDGPAVEYEDGTKYWCQNDEPHRLDGPAIEWNNGDKFWYQNGKCHRLDGPAEEYANGTKYWYINNKKYNSIEDWAKEALSQLGKPNDPISVQRYISQIRAKQIRAKLGRR